MAFKVPEQTEKYTQEVETFLGVDLNNTPSNVDKSRSPEAPNMIRDQIGKVRKRMGHKQIIQTAALESINGVHMLGSTLLIHSGDTLYERSLVGTAWSLDAIADGLANGKSRSFTFDGKLYLMDGYKFRVYDGETVENVEDIATVPTIIISRRPSGGGTTYKPLNLLSRKWTESFKGEADITAYQLTTEELDSDAVTAEVLDSGGTWQPRTEKVTVATESDLPARGVAGIAYYITADSAWKKWTGSAYETMAAPESGTTFTVDRESGTVTFETAPGATPVTGQDSVHITAAKTRSGYADKINKCTLFAVYGVNGATDRVFASGNIDNAGVDWYCEYEDPTYWPDTGYTKIIRDGGEIIGYAVLDNKLAAFINGASDERNVVVRTGTLDDDGNAVFRITNTIIGEDAVAADSFCRTDKEPLFLTKRGVYAITAEELTGEKYSQERSYFIRDKIQACSDKRNAVACMYGDFYVLAIDDTMYLLDTGQKTYERNAPYSSYQMECYYWPGIAATTLWTEDGILYYGTDNGTIHRFNDDKDSAESYADQIPAVFTATQILTENSYTLDYDGTKWTLAGETANPANYGVTVPTDVKKYDRIIITKTSGVYSAVYQSAITAYWETGDFDGKTFFKVKSFCGVAVRLAAASQTGVEIQALRQGLWEKVYDAAGKAQYFVWDFIDFTQFTFLTDTTPRTMFGKLRIKKVDKVRFRMINDKLNEPFGLYAIGVQWKEPGNVYKR